MCRCLQLSVCLKGLSKKIIKEAIVSRWRVKCMKLSLGMCCVPSGPFPTAGSHSALQSKHFIYEATGGIWTWDFWSTVSCFNHLATVSLRFYNKPNQEYIIFARSDALATTSINFITQFCVASIREQLLFESGVLLCYVCYNNRLGRMRLGWHMTAIYKIDLCTKAYS